MRVVGSATVMCYTNCLLFQQRNGIPSFLSYDYKLLRNFRQANIYIAVGRLCKEKDRSKFHHCLASF